MIEITPSDSYSIWEPRPLPIPIIQPIHMDDVTAVAPEFEGTDLETVLDTIAAPEAQERYIEGLRSLDAQQQSKGCAAAPTFNDAIPPTHLLIAHNGMGGPSLAYPVHTLLLAAHCSLLPPLISPSPQPEGTQHKTDLIVPYPAAFDIVREYIYTHSLRALMSRLLNDDLRRAVRCAEDVECATRSISALEEDEILERAATVLAVYEDARTLGMVDRHFWEQVQLASCIIASAYELRKTADMVQERQIWQDDEVPVAAV